MVRLGLLQLQPVIYIFGRNILCSMLMLFYSIIIQTIDKLTYALKIIWLLIIKYKKMTQKSP